MSEIVFLLEERSAKVMLEGLLPRILPNTIKVRYIVFEGKQDLEKQLVRKLRGYLKSDVQFIILRDQDSGDCKDIKKNLYAKCLEAGKSETIIRIACRELESWYLADLEAVEKGMGLPGIASLQGKRLFRKPDSAMSPSIELKRLVPHYQKIDGSRRISPHLKVDNKRSLSFYHLIQAVKKLTV
jgi:hypothetical protein